MVDGEQADMSTNYINALNVGTGLDTSLTMPSLTRAGCPASLINDKIETRRCRFQPSQDRKR